MNENVLITDHKLYNACKETLKNDMGDVNCTSNDCKTVLNNACQDTLKNSIGLMGNVNCASTDIDTFSNDCVFNDDNIGGETIFNNDNVTTVA